MKILLIAITLTVCPSMAIAQAFNINLGINGSPTPPSDYGAAAGQQGVWNTVWQFNKTYLQDLAGGATSVFIQKSMNAAEAGNISGASTNDNILMKSYWWANSYTNYLAVGGLSPGQYRFYLYGWGGVWNVSGSTIFSVAPGSDKGEYQIIWGPTWNGQVENGTYAVANVNVASGNTLLGISFPYADAEHAMLINGIQIVQVPAPTAGALLASALLVGMRRRR